MGMQTDVARRLFTVEEYDRMVEVGVLGNDDRVELIDGEVVAMRPIGHRHGACVAALAELLILRVGQRARVWVQSPVQTGGRAKPVPALALLSRRSYRETGPTEADVLLLVEVADSSMAYDHVVKLRLYARAGIPELWIVDVDAALVDLYRGPVGDGYRHAPRRAAPGQKIVPGAFPDATIPVAGIFA